MKIDKAIEIQTDMRDEVRIEDPADKHDALQLGIEALKRELANRSGSKYVIVAPLKGED